MNQNEKNNISNKKQKEKQTKTQVNPEEENIAEKTITNKEKAICAVSYFFILFFLPLVVFKKFSFAKFHANQSLVLLIVSFVVSVVIAIFEQIFKLLGVQMVGTILGSIWAVVILLGMCWGVVSAAQGKKRALPVIGKIQILR